MNTTSELINEIAVFSLQQFFFGVDTRQIQEIVTIKNPELLVEPDETCSFILLRYHNHPLPVLNLYKKFHLQFTSSRINQLFSAMTIITFSPFSQHVACLVDLVETITSVSPQFLKAVPPILTHSAHEMCVWGFYEMTDPLAPMIIPLIDLHLILTHQDIADYTAMLSTLPIPPF